MWIKAFNVQWDKDWNVQRGHLHWTAIHKQAESSKKLLERVRNNTHAWICVQFNFRAETQVSVSQKILIHWFTWCHFTDPHYNVKNLHSPVNHSVLSKMKVLIFYLFWSQTNLTIHFLSQFFKSENTEIEILFEKEKRNMFTWQVKIIIYIILQ